LFIAMRAFYGLSLWITPHLLFTYPDLHHRLLGGFSREAVHYVAKIDLGGVAGVVAPMIGKQPPDSQIWILGGEAPVFLKSETLSYMGGPIWRIELVSPVWPQASAADSKKGTATTH
jgi:hypothetical protein